MVEKEEDPVVSLHLPKVLLSSVSLFLFMSIPLNSVQLFIGIRCILKSQYYYIVHKLSISVKKQTKKKNP